MPDDFAGGVAVITGAGSGIGAGLADQAARIGMRVVVSDVDLARARAVATHVSRTGAEAHAVRTDVRDAAALQSLAAFVHQNLGSVRLLINNAGVTVFGPCWELTPAQWHDALDTNLHGVIHGVCAFVPNMIRANQRAAVVNVSSLGGLTSLPLTAPYTVSKHAVLALSECLYLEMQLLNLPIDVSVVVPGLVNTHIYDASIMSRGGSSAGDTFRQVIQAASTAQGVSPDEAAGVILRQVMDRSFWVSTDHEMTRATAEARADYLRRQARPQLPDLMRDALERALADRR
jgi:NAD(P)-dependent dehydrogenase (short-subunit alcohol dehydrogenase family)